MSRINGIGVMLWLSGLLAVFLGIMSMYMALNYSPVLFNCTLQNIICGVGSVFLTTDMVTLLIDREYVTFGKNISKL